MEPQASEFYGVNISGARRSKGSREVAVERFGLNLGPQEACCPEKINDAVEKLEKAGLRRRDITPLVLTDASGAPCVTLQWAPRDKENLPTHPDLLSRLKTAGLMDETQAAEAAADLEDRTMTFGERVKARGLWAALKHSYRTGPTRVLGAVYMVGDIFSLITGSINSLGLVKSKGTADLAMGVAFSGGDAIRLKWGDKTSGKSGAEELLEGIAKDLSAAHPGQFDKPDTGSFMDNNAASIAKFGNIGGSVSLAVSGFQQQNPNKYWQSFFSGVGFVVALSMPPKGIPFEESGLGKFITSNPLTGLFKKPAARFYDFLQDNPNSLIALSLIHNGIGIWSAIKDHRRAEPNKEDIKAAYSDFGVNWASGTTQFQEFLEKSAPEKIKEHASRALADAGSFGDATWVTYPLNDDASAVYTPPGGAHADARFRPATEEEAARAEKQAHARIGSKEEPFILTLESGKKVACFRNTGGLRERYETFATEQLGEAIAEYQMFGRLKLSAPFYAATFGSFMFANALFGITKEPKKDVDPRELFSLIATDTLNRLAAATPETQAQVFEHFALLINALAERPEIRHAAQNGRIEGATTDKGAAFVALLGQHVNNTLAQIAQVTGQEHLLNQWGRVLAAQAGIAPEQMSGASPETLAALAQNTGRQVADSTLAGHTDGNIQKPVPTAADNHLGTPPASHSMPSLT